MGSLSDFAENKLLDHLFGKGEYTPPDIFVALSTSDPGDDGLGKSEPSGYNYSRVATNPLNWTSATGGALSNETQINFPPAQGPWGTITHIMLMSHGTSGDMLMHGALTQSKEISQGDTAKFAVGDIDVSLD